MPVFVANGDSDPMILPHYSYLLAGPTATAQSGFRSGQVTS
jgi:hypothetical protein